MKNHALMLNLGTKRAWCILCHSEVYLFNNQPPVPHVNTLKAREQSTANQSQAAHLSSVRRSASSASSDRGVKNSPSCSSLYSLNADNPLIPPVQGTNLYSRINFLDHVSFPPHVHLVSYYTPPARKHLEKILHN